MFTVNYGIISAILYSVRSAFQLAFFNEVYYWIVSTIIFQIIFNVMHGIWPHNEEK